MTINTLNDMSVLWQKVLHELSKEIDKTICDTFLNESYIHSIEGDKILVSCNSNLAATILSQQYSDLVNEVVNNITGTNFKVIFINHEELKDNSISEIESRNNRVFFKGCSIDPSFTFDNFVTGPSNKEATQASLFVASAPGKCYNPLFIYGGSGLGKTHLLNAISNFLKERNPSLKILYVTAQDFFYQYVDYVKGQDKNEELSKYIKDHDILLVDDIQMLRGKDKTLEFFFNIFQHFIQNKKQIILTSDKTPNELSGVDARLVSRFMDGLTVQINKPTQEMCENILKKKIVGANLSVDDFDNDVISFMAQKFTSSVRELNGALNRIIFIKNIRHSTRVDLDLAYEALGDLISVKDVQNTINEQKILNCVALYYNLSVSQITGKLKTGQIVIARHIAIYLIRNMLDVSLNKIGQIFSNRDHTTIMHSISAVDKMLKTDPETKNVIDTLKAKISGK
ncbi:MAG: chromosomal replication initiator protein DnaA [Candidatus Onthovivens sp.]|nr:chromosomal replication initiator protein DnaA [Candidatus Onthovivens sp.]